MFFLALLTSLALALPLSAAPPEQEFSQVEAQELAAKARELGSDQSLRVSATNAMQALLKFDNNDVLGAASQAFKAYGTFKNSENLDRLRKQGILAKYSLATAGTNNLSDSEVNFLSSSTSYRRLDPSFLSSGKEGELAAEFEKKTGIRRKDFLDMLASAAENKLYASDPKLAEKVDSEFESFLSKIPNLEFRVKVREGFGMVPGLARHKLLVQAMQGAIHMAAKLKEPQISEQELAKVAEPTVLKTELARTPAAAASIAEKAEKKEEGMMISPKSLLGSSDEAKGLMHPISMNNVLPAESEDANAHLKLENVVGAALQSHPENESIFFRVSRRYQAILRRGGL